MGVKLANDNPIENAGIPSDILTSAAGGNPIILALLGILGKYMNDKQAADVYTPRQAMSGITDLSKNPMSSQLTNALSGTPASSTTSAVQNAVTNRANQQITAPTLNLQNRYNPYVDSSGNATSFGNVNPTLLASVLNMAKSSPTTANDLSTLQNNLANRGSSAAQSALLQNLQNRGTPTANTAMLANLQNRGNDTLFNSLYSRYNKRFGG